MLGSGKKSQSVLLITVAFTLIIIAVHIYSMHRGIKGWC